MAKTIFDKIWESHIVKDIPEGPSILYIDRHFIHEVTSPQAFSGLEKRGLKVLRPKQTFATCDHNVPTLNQDKPINDPTSRIPIERLAQNTSNHDITYFPLGHPSNGVVHIIGPELGITQCGMTIVCGDSHTSTHGALGNIAFGIGTSEVEMVFATQTLLQSKPLQMLIEINGNLQKGVCAKDLILHIISKMGTSGGTGYFIEFAGNTIENLSMEERMTVCNMSIEMGARGGLIAPDKKTFNYLEGREFTPKKEEWVQSVKKWSELKSDLGAKYDAVNYFNACEIEPMVTYGTNPGMGIPVTGKIPFSLTDYNLSDKESSNNNSSDNKTSKTERSNNESSSFIKALKYMGLTPGMPIAGLSIDYVFLGSCTNGRIEDFRDFASIVQGRKKDPNVIAWLVPGSKAVAREIEIEGIGQILREAGFEIREPGCSACLGMNQDKIPANKYAVSTSNRNFEGRQGPGARTILAGPLIAAVAAITGKINDPRDFL